MTGLAVAGRKAEGKNQAQVQHRRLASAEQAEERRRYWAERLDGLVALLEKPRARLRQA
jgi:hypothetical protein